MSDNVNRNERILIHLMAIDQDEYNEKVFDYGLAYLDATCPRDSSLQEALAHSPWFWEWWKRQWNRRNRILVHDLMLEDYADNEVDELSIGMVADAFEAAHDPHYLTIRPHRFILQQSFDHFWNQKVFEELNESDKTE